MLYRLIFLSGPQTGQRVTITEAPVTLGTDPECDICVEDRECARRHIELVHVGARLSVRDLGSMNHFLVNGRELTESVLKHGDIVEVGKTRLLVQCSVQAEVGGSDRRRKRQRKGLLLLILFLVAGSIYYARTREGEIQPESAPPPPAGPAVVTNASATSMTNAMASPALALPPPAPRPAKVGQPPRINATFTDVVAGSNISFAVTATDPDGIVPASLTALDLPRGAVFAKPRVEGLELVGHVAWTPTTNEIGTNRFTFIAADQEQLSTGRTFSVTVTPPPVQPPTKRQLAQQQLSLAMNAKRDPAGLAAATELLLDALKIDPAFDQARVELARVREERGMFRRAAQTWTELAGMPLDPVLMAQVRSEQARLNRKLSELDGQSVLSITGYVERMAGDIQYADTRVLSLTLKSTSAEPLDYEDVRVEVIFFVDDPAKQIPVPSTTMVRRVEGAWAAGQARNLSSMTFHPPGAPGQSHGYAGFVARVYCGSILQAACAKPETLLSDGDRSRRTP